MVTKKTKHPTKTAVQALTKRSFYLSHFTPSMLPASTLEELLVKRAGLVKRVVKSAVDSVKTGGLHHHLFVGPRGIGKTHLISLLFHHLSNDKTIKSKAKLVWMREEEWGVTSFSELILRILRNMDANDPTLGIKAKTDALYELPPKQLEPVVTQILLDMLQGKTLIILLENLDDLFEQMGDVGQKKWRAFIQNHPQFVMLATTPALFAGVTSQKAAFYGWFDTEALDELSFDEVVELLEKIALYRGDQELADFINTPDGKARIRAVHHLAEGNPRIYIIFAQFLSKAALDELVQAFMHTLDQLTPYYQARMKEQSGQQRKILEFLVQYRGAAPVKEIAKACLISQQVCSSQLLVLRERRFVRVEERGRERYYELKEPLMRLCMEVKSARGEASSLLVEMLRIWYSEQDLEGLAKDQDRISALALQCVEKALALKRAETVEPAMVAVVKDICLAMDKNGIASLSLLEEFTSIKTKNASYQVLQDLTRWSLLQPPHVTEDENIRIKQQLVNHMVRYPNQFKGHDDMLYIVVWISMRLVVSRQQDDVLINKLIEWIETAPTQMAKAIFKLFLTMDKENAPLFNEWIAQWLDALRSQGDRDLLFQAPFMRMLKAYGSTLKDESNITNVLALPSEERKLVMQMLERVKGKKLDPPLTNAIAMTAHRCNSSHALRQ